MEITFQGTKICLDIFVLQMDGVNVNMGVQLFKTVWNIMTNYNELSMEFGLQNKLIRWEGESLIDETTLSARELKNLKGLTHRAYLCKFEIIFDKGKATVVSDNNNLTIAKRNLLWRNKAFFEETTELLPTKAQDHHICIEQGLDQIMFSHIDIPNIKKLKWKN